MWIHPQRKIVPEIYTGGTFTSKKKKKYRDQMLKDIFIYECRSQEWVKDLGMRSGIWSKCRIQEWVQEVGASEGFGNECKIQKWEQDVGMSEGLRNEDAPRQQIIILKII